MEEQTRAEQVRDHVAAVVHHIDAKRWNELRALYAEQVRTDYTSLFGGGPPQQAGDALIAGWRSVLERVSTQHLLGPITVRFEAQSATALCTCARCTTRPAPPAASSGRSWVTTRFRSGRRTRAGRSRR